MEDVAPEKRLPSDGRGPPEDDLCLVLIDDNPDGRFLVAKTLLRKFPGAVIVECESASAAFRALEKPVNLIVLHRTRDCDAVALLRELRRRKPDVPVVMMSDLEREAEALAAGASLFLTYEQWLMIGHHAAALLRDRAPAGGPT
jgi:DNA-binding NtrC family response regulator